MKGKNYRKVWDTPVKVPVFDLSMKKDSLFVVKRGGGDHLTVILKDAVIHGVTVDESNITFEYPNF